MGPYVFGLDHGYEKIQNSVLLVIDHFMGPIGSETPFDLTSFYTHSWDVYIGNKPLWSDNPKCPGGPHLKSTHDEYYDKCAFSSWGKTTSPAFGFEAWCNMSG